MPDIALGARVLGAGGGGNPYLAALRLRMELRQGRRVIVWPLDLVAEDSAGCAVSGMGAPTVGIEKLPRGDEMWAAVRALQGYVGRQADYIVIGEIGGGNSIAPLVAAAQAGLPVIDADPMGRAFPELQMDTFMIGGVKPYPFALHDAHGQTVVFDQVLDPFSAERLARAVTTAMGASAALALPWLTGEELRRTAISGTLSLALHMGRAIRHARREGVDPIDALLRVSGGKRLFHGKIVDVDRRTTGGFARGTVTLAGLDEDEGSECRVAIQNEFLVAWKEGKGGEEVLATTPDLITLLDEETGDPVGTEMLRYGLRLQILGIPAAAQLKTREALEVVGPRAFGYDLDFKPLSGNLGDPFFLAERKKSGEDLP
ncbi:MAG: DUF917 domain-containing protein [Bacillota bacterium]|nr:DUF917 domain-containing protein [Bacillota bacterium]